MANPTFYAPAALACHRMKAVQLLCQPHDCQSWTKPTLLKQTVRLPATLARHAQRLVAPVEVAVSWLEETTAPASLEKPSWRGAPALPAP